MPIGDCGCSGVIVLYSVVLECCPQHDCMTSLGTASLVQPTTTSIIFRYMQQLRLPSGCLAAELDSARKQRAK